MVALTQSLLIRGLRWDSVIANIRNLVPLGVAIIPRIIDNTQKATFASQSHRRSAPKDDGTIAVRDLYVRYGANLPDVLQGIDLAVPSGEFLYLAGKSAAGKTTLLRTLGGVIPRVMGEFRGRVVVSGMATHEVPLAVLTASARYVAPDPFASIHGLTVGQEISFLAPDENAAHEALGVMGLADLWDRETTKLSGGQQVRLVLAGALASEARIFLLDAPMQELDPEGRVAFMEALAILRSRRPCTIVVADPFWQDLASYTNRVIVLEEGRLLAPLVPEDFFAETWLARCHLQSREGAAAPNLIPLSLEGEGQRVRAGEVVATLEGVHVALEGTQILHGVDFAARQGELVAVMGPNGSGKTTAMLTLAGAIKPQKGAVRTRGRVGYVFQHAQLQTVAMTVEEELAFGPRVLRWPEPAAKAFVMEGAAWTGLGRDACPIDLHPADVRMLMIAACNTDLSTLILDEPTIGLDGAGIEKVMQLVKELLLHGKAVVIITHDQAIAGQAHRVVTIRDGLVEHIRERRNSQEVLPAR
ncbi:MAG: ABC transporter ATP-binding protein [Bacillati bacterium ANGP1]|uniref:ABC transporter ATP-binding protein n=1 Tax=Candidatus Segetimicrobium genomatis TaxID=2569760 RepID=A0A537IGE0_9BACT|nr:MAG: ABC transporter ATP-binding protein [Terrabacteria group bacterium ANGP1]